MAKYVSKDIICAKMMHCNFRAPDMTVSDFINDELPAADVQSIVHCKDCKYRKEHHYEAKGEAPYVKYSCKFTTYSMSGEGFCSFGTRMDGEDNGRSS